MKLSAKVFSIVDTNHIPLESQRLNYITWITSVNTAIRMGYQIRLKSFKRN